MMPGWLVRTARIVALAIIIGWSLANVIQRVSDWSLSDMDAYWNAAMRLREGAPLYPALADPGAADVYRYSPWFAWAWVPLTYVSHDVVAVGWSALLAIASVATAVLIARRGSLTAIAAGTLIGSLMLWSAASGNVQPLLVATLAWGVERRSGPVWIGLAASLKIFPVLYALVYVGRRQWSRAIVAAVIGAALFAWTLAYDLSNYPRSVSDSPNPLLGISPVAYVAVVLVAAAITLAVARTRFGWLAAAATVFLAIPRASLIDLSHAAVGANRTDHRRTIGLGESGEPRANVPREFGTPPGTRATHGADG
jgi:hypothetical protein